MRVLIPASAFGPAWFVALQPWLMAAVLVVGFVVALARFPTRRRLFGIVLALVVASLLDLLMAHPRALTAPVVYCGDIIPWYLCWAV